MNWYYYLNYKLYKYYQKKGEDMPALFSYIITVLLLFMNIFSVIGLVALFYPTKPHINKMNAFFLIILIALFNYTLIYRCNHYKEIFNRFDNDSMKYEAWNLFVKVYVILSVILLLVVLGMADYLN